MRTLTLAFILPLLFLILCAFGGSAHGLTMDDIAEREEQKLVKQHIVNYPKSEYYDHRLYTEHHKPQHYASTRPIDGYQPVIEISQAERSGYVQMPIKPNQEKYYGR